MQVDKFEKAAEVFRKHGGVLRTVEALRSGIHHRTLYAMRDSGLLERVSRGVYRLAGSPPLGNPVPRWLSVALQGGKQQVSYRFSP